MDIKELAATINRNPFELLIEVERLNSDHQLGITNFADLTRTQYDIIRASMDTAYLVTLFDGDKRGGKYNYQSTLNYADINTWVGDIDLDGFSTADIKESLPDHITHRGHQVIAAIMRSNGYESRVVVLDNGKQGRRWSKPVVSFL